MPQQDKNFVLFLLISGLLLITSPLHAAIDDLIKERIPYGKTIRTRMPPQLVIENVQKVFNANSPKWKTFWQNFVVEEDPVKNEFIIIGRSVEKKWAFGMIKEDCP